MIKIESYLPVVFKEIKFGDGTGYEATLYYNGGMFKASSRTKGEAELMIEKSLQEVYPEFEFYSMESQ